MLWCRFLGEGVASYFFSQLFPGKQLWYNEFLPYHSCRRVLFRSEKFVYNLTQWEKQINALHILEFNNWNLPVITTCYRSNINSIFISISVLIKQDRNLFFHESYFHSCFGHDDSVPVASFHFMISIKITKMEKQNLLDYSSQWLVLKESIKYFLMYHLSFV
jgi:hypothetical protein